MVKNEPVHEKTNNLGSTRSNTNRAVQLQKMARGWTFWIKKVEELYYPCSEKKALISFAVTAKLIFAFVFTYADYIIMLIYKYSTK